MRIFFSLVFVCQYWFVAGQTFEHDHMLTDELKHRLGKTYKEEKYFKNSQLDSVFRRWGIKGNKLTEGYYINGKRHGKWTEWLSRTYNYDYVTINYEKGTPKSLYYYLSSFNDTTLKSAERLFIYKPDRRNYVEKVIKWHSKEKVKSEETTETIRKGKLIEKKTKWWRKNGKPWEERLLKCAFDRSGKYLGQRKHGTWRLWNEDGTLQKETWYDMGQKLREKLYDHGKLTSDKKY